MYLHVYMYVDIESDNRESSTLFGLCATMDKKVIVALNITGFLVVSIIFFKIIMQIH